MNLDLKRIAEWPLPFRFGVLGAVFILTVFLGYYVDISKLGLKLAHSKNQEQELKLQYEALARKKTELTYKISHLPELQSQLFDIRKSIIKHEELAEMLNTILKAGGNNHLHFILFDPDPAIKANEYEKLPIKVVVVGTYHQIADFISQLANLPTLVFIEDFAITSDNKSDVLGAKLAEQADAQNLLTSEMLLSVYYQPEGPEGEADAKK